jgi:hypothetical protein
VRDLHERFLADPSSRVLAAFMLPQSTYRFYIFDDVDHVLNWVVQTPQRNLSFTTVVESGRPVLLYADFETEQNVAERSQPALVAAAGHLMMRALRVVYPDVVWPPAAKSILDLPNCYEFNGSRPGKHSTHIHCTSVAFANVDEHRIFMDRVRDLLLDGEGEEFDSWRATLIVHYAKDGKDCVDYFVDWGVYSKNRNFRLPGNHKPPKTLGAAVYPLKAENAAAKALSWKDQMRVAMIVDYEGRAVTLPLLAPPQRRAPRSRPPQPDGAAQPAQPADDELTEEVSSTVKSIAVEALQLRGRLNESHIRVKFNHDCDDFLVTFPLVTAGPCVCGKPSHAEGNNKASCIVRTTTGAKMLVVHPCCNKSQHGAWMNPAGSGVVSLNRYTGAVWVTGVGAENGRDAKLLAKLAYAAFPPAVPHAHGYAWDEVIVEAPNELSDARANGFYGFTHEPFTAANMFTSPAPQHIPGDKATVMIKSAVNTQKTRFAFQKVIEPAIRAGKKLVWVTDLIALGQEVHKQAQEAVPGEMKMFLDLVGGEQLSGSCVVSIRSLHVVSEEGTPPDWLILDEFRSLLAFCMSAVLATAQGGHRAAFYRFIKLICAAKRVLVMCQDLDDVCLQVLAELRPPASHPGVLYHNLFRSNNRTLHILPNEAAMLELSAKYLVESRCSGFITTGRVRGENYFEKLGVAVKTEEPTIPGSLYSRFSSREEMETLAAGNLDGELLIGITPKVTTGVNIMLPCEALFIHAVAASVPPRTLFQMSWRFRQCLVPAAASGADEVGPVFGVFANAGLPLSERFPETLDGVRQMSSKDWDRTFGAAFRGEVALRNMLDVDFDTYRMKLSDLFGKIFTHHVVERHRALNAPRDAFLGRWCASGGRVLVARRPLEPSKKQAVKRKLTETMEDAHVMRLLRVPDTPVQKLLDWVGVRNQLSEKFVRTYGLNASDTMGQLRNFIALFTLGSEALRTNARSECDVSFPDTVAVVDALPAKCEYVRRLLEATGLDLFATQPVRILAGASAEGVEEDHAQWLTANMSDIYRHFQLPRSAKSGEWTRLRCVQLLQQILPRFALIKVDKPPKPRHGGMRDGHRDPDYYPVTVKVAEPLELVVAHFAHRGRGASDELQEAASRVSADKLTWTDMHGLQPAENFGEILTSHSLASVNFL